jgi:hypothetical protein
MVAAENPVPTEVFMRKAFSLLGALALGVAATTMTRPAAAQAFGNQGDITFSAERLMGIYFYDEGNQNSETAIGIGFQLPDRVYTQPRLGVDYFVIDNLSIGAALGFSDIDRDHQRSYSGAIVAPRVGYALEFNKTFGFWPRGGFTYRTFGGDEEFALTLEAMFYAAPIEHFAITFGPLMDLGLAGTLDEAKNFALLSAGILGWI